MKHFITFFLIPFLVGFQIPRVSSVSVLLASAYFISKKYLLNKNRFKNVFLTSSTFLLGLCFLYAITFVLHGIKEPLRATTLTATIWASYVLGYNLPYAKGISAEKSVRWTLTAVAVGATLYIFIPLYATVGSGLHIPDVKDIYGSRILEVSDNFGNKIVGTRADMYSVLGVSTLPAVLLAITSNKWNGKLWIITVLVVVSMSLYSVLSLGGRKPMIVLTVVLLPTLIHIFMSTNKGYIYRIITGLIVLILIVNAYDIWSYLSQSDLFWRFEKKRMRSERWNEWYTFLSVFPVSVSGSPYLNIGGINGQSTHNFMLDTIWFSGLPAFFFLLSFVSYPVLAAYRTAVNLRKRMVVRVLIIAVFLSSIAVMMAEPLILQYMSVFSFISGVLVRADKSRFFCSKEHCARFG